VQRVVDELGRLDILVNNAAFQQHQKRIEDLTDEQLERTFRTNIFGYFHMARAAIRHMKPGSAIINTGIDHGSRGERGTSRLFGDQGAPSRVHEIARAELGGEDSRE
jgi:NAD(P)-dependent dehydrogenase (short-subunit alcohol dehydrogenase family)